ncbi:MAG: alpha/beta hydrolase [Patescibacteria group bacterium]
MKRVIIVHGWVGNPKENWFPWLKKELEGIGCEVLIPQLPEAETPKIDNWVPMLSKVAGEVDENTYFVGHGMGCQTIARYLETLKEGKKVGGVVFVAGFFKRLTGLEIEDQKVWKHWLNTPINFEKIKSHFLTGVAIFSDNDSYVPLDNQDDFRDKLGSKITILSRRGHFSGGEDQCFELPEALNALEKIFELRN